MNAGIYLKDVILETLSKYGVHPKQLYTITLDNGANMIKAVDLVEKEAFIELENESESMLSSSKEKQILIKQMILLTVIMIGKLLSFISS